MTPVLVAPHQNSVVTLAPDFVQPQEGYDKQDCALAASARWLDRWGAHYAPWGIAFRSERGGNRSAVPPHRQEVFRHLSHRQSVPLRNGDDALVVNWCELVTTNAEGNVLFRNAWARSHGVTDDNVVALAAAG